MIVLTCAFMPTRAAQISPSPNPSSHTIDVSDSVTNGESSYTNNGTIVIGNGGELTNNGGLANNGVISNNNIVNNYGTLTNAPGGTLTHNGGSFGRLWNYSGATLSNAGTLFNTAGSRLVNEGTLNSSGAVDNYGTLINDGALSNSGALTNRSGAELTNAGTFSNTGTLTNHDWLANSGTFSNSGTLSSSGWLSNASYGALNNSGVLTSSGITYNYLHGTLTNGAGGTLSNAGAFHNWGGLSNAGDLSNSGTLTNYGFGALINDGGITNTGTLNNDGMLINNAGGTLTNAGELFDDAGSTLTNSGTLNNVSGGWLCNMDGAILTNSGHLSNYAGAQLTNQDGSFMTNDGTLTNNGWLGNDSGSVLTNNGMLINNNALINYATLTNAGTLSNNAGAILINAGTLTNSAGASFINNGTFTTSSGAFSNLGTLMGIGIINGDVTNSGTIAPGNSIGALTVNGNLTFSSGSVYAVEVNAAGQSDQTIVSGSATIESGSTVSILAEPGNYGTQNHYTILSAASISGQFNGVTGHWVFLTPSLSYDAANVYLLLTRNATRFTDVAMTANQVAVASGLDRIALQATGDMENVLSRLLSLSAEGARSAYNRIGGLMHPALAEASFFAFNHYLSVLSSRVSGFSKTSPSFAGRMLLASLDNTASDAGKAPAPERGFWIKGSGIAADRHDDDISSKYTYRAAGIAAGYDSNIGKHFLLGASAGYTAAFVNMDALDDKAGVSIYSASLYGGYSASPWYVNGIIAYGYNRYDTVRNIVFGGINRTAKAAYTGHVVGGYAEAGYNLDIKTVSVAPLVSLQGGYLTRDGFAETGADSLNLNVDKENSKSLVCALGVRVKKDFRTACGVLTPEAKLRWQHEFLNADYSIDASFSGYSSSAFTVRTDEAARDTAAIDLGIVWMLANNLDANAGYEATLSADRMQHAATLGLKYRW